MNDATVLAAIAAHLSSATPPAGYALRKVHTYPPDTLAVVPACVLLPADDSITYGATNRQVTLNVSATVYIQPQVDLSRRYTDLMVWRTWIRDVFLNAVTLNNTATVAQASVTGTTVGTDRWGDTDFLTISATLEVTSIDSVNTSA